MIPSVRAQALVCRIGGAVVIDGLDLTVASGENIALSGPNGSGRTTLLQVLATLRAPHAGTVQIAGVDALRFPFEARAHVMYVGDLQAAGGLRVREYLDVVRDARGAGAATRGGSTTSTALERSALSPDADVQRLSPGQRKQLALAAAMMVAPPLLLLDDPLASLDEEARRRFCAWLTDVRAGGTTIVAVVNTPADADALGSTMLRMARGRLVSSATALGVELDRVGAPALTTGNA